MVMVGVSSSKPEKVGKLLLRSSKGAMVPLTELAYVCLTWGATPFLTMQGGSARLLPATFQVVTSPHSLCPLGGKLESDVVFPKGAYMTFGGAAEAVARPSVNSCQHSHIAGDCLAHTPNVLLVLANAPFALVGGVAHGALLGMMFFGITMRNPIMLISHYEHLVLVEGAEWNLAATNFWSR